MNEVTGEEGNQMLKQSRYLLVLRLHGCMPSYLL